MEKQPNILILMVDEERYPVVYEDKRIREWRRKNFKAQEFLRQKGFEFCNHYAGSCACAPSRATLYTGQYPSLHGVSQTPGIAKEDFDSDMYWLDPNTVPTFGDYLKQGGYTCYWRGKWHASQADIISPGPGHTPYPSYNENTGVPEPIKVGQYNEANKLSGYGFEGWIGPEPFGRLAVNSGSSSPNKVNGRDEIFANESIELIEALDKDYKENGIEKPWMIMTSFVNPHDIALYGGITRLSEDFNFVIDPSVPPIPKAPTSDESLRNKPRCQRSYKKVYQKAFQPTRNTLEYRQLYYSLQLEADRQMWRVIEALCKSSFYEDTMIIFTSDHGDLGGSHGNMFQKWYQAYEETIHVPLIFHYPKWFSSYQKTDVITSHVDILPTLLNISQIDPKEAKRQLKANHILAKTLVGRDLTPLFRGEELSDEPIYFMTDDNVTKGQNQETIEGKTYESVVQPSSVETVVVYLKDNTTGQKVKWKFSRYFNNTTFWTSPNKEDKNIQETQTFCCEETDYYSITRCAGRPEFEMYNLTEDPIEAQNLIPYCSWDREVALKADQLHVILVEQRKKKRKQE